MNPATIWQRMSATLVSLLALVNVCRDLLFSLPLGRLPGITFPVDGIEGAPGFQSKKLKERPTVIAQFNLTYVGWVFSGDIGQRAIGIPNDCLGP